MQRAIVFASGTAKGGGSGFENLVNASRLGILQAEIVAVISNHGNGGVAEKARRLGIQFLHMRAPFDGDRYWALFKGLGADFALLSGWLKKVNGLDPRKTINIHPGPLPEFGGKGMHGHHVHEAVIKAFKRGEITHSAVSMHFVTKEYDMGPVFFRCPVPIKHDDTPDTLGSRVNEMEHLWQPAITNLVMQGIISWDGKDPSSLKTIVLSSA
ncbi:MAG TPA: formyltransferase family protein [Candidatus Paceibacterota bacterium]